MIITIRAYVKKKNQKVGSIRTWGKIAYNLKLSVLGIQCYLFSSFSYSLVHETLIDYLTYLQHVSPTMKSRFRNTINQLYFQQHRSIGWLD